MRLYFSQSPISQSVCSDFILQSDSEEDDEQNIWDDGKLNEAYDKALDIANAEVARRIAMNTNSQPGKDMFQVYLVYQLLDVA